MAIFKRIIICLCLTLAWFVYPNSAAAQGSVATFSSPVTSDAGGYRKFDSTAINGKFHSGDDYYNKGLKVLAANCGVVVKKIINGQGDHGFGNTLIVRHDLADAPVYSLYGHLAGFAEGTDPNNRVTRGQPLGTMGSTGSGSNKIVHLHFEIKRLPTLANPSAFGSRASETQYGYVPIDAGTKKATSATDYGYFRPNSMYGGYQASCSSNRIEGQPKAVVSTSLRFDQGNGPFTVGQKIDGSFTIANRGNAKLVMKRVVIGGHFGKGCPNDRCPDFLPITRDITLAQNATHYYRGDFVLSSVGTYTFFVSYEKSDGKWEKPVASENGTVNQISITVNRAGPTLTGMNPPSLRAKLLPQTVYLSGAWLAKTNFIRMQFPNGKFGEYWLLPWEIFSRSNNQLGAKIRFSARGPYTIWARSSDGVWSNALRVDVN